MIVQFSWARAALRAAALAAIAAAGASCTSSGGGQIDSTLGSASQSAGASPAAEAQQPAQQEVLDPRAYCPKTVLRAGTETYNLFPAKVKKDDPQAPRLLRFRATITGVVRECNYAGDILNIKVGVEGRLLSGPSGETGSFTMPIRIAVTRGTEVLFTTLHDVPADIPPGRTNNVFRFVDDQVSIPKPTSENLVIYVGFDEQRIDPPGAQAKKPKVN
ncbi:MAG TPA: hypothetical protein VLQ68_06900 [Rhizobiaceae bacterium]|nr:hypothetical protein [Rhizobiaceae bacterium]